jgi:hypothetical protein
MMFITLFLFSLTFLTPGNAQQVVCNSVNVDSNRQFNNCVSSILSSSAVLASYDQFTTCSSKNQNQKDYLNCVCQKTNSIADW